jgi:antitoxin MazE
MMMKRATIKKRSAKRRRKARSPRGLTAKIIRIGNSRGLRLPKAVIEQAGLGDEVEIVVHGSEVVLRSTKHPRAGWDAQIKKALAEHGDDIEDWRDWQNMPNKFDKKEWTW